jgi:hypothetical protein
VWGLDGVADLPGPACGTRSTLESPTPAVPRSLELRSFPASSSRCLEASSRSAQAVRQERIPPSIQCLLRDAVPPRQFRRRSLPTQQHQSNLSTLRNRQIRSLSRTARSFPQQEINPTSKRKPHTSSFPGTLSSTSALSQPGHTTALPRTVGLVPGMGAPVILPVSCSLFWCRRRHSPHLFLARQEPFTLNVGTCAASSAGRKLTRDDRVRAPPRGCQQKYGLEPHRGCGTLRPSRGHDCIALPGRHIHLYRY